MQLEQLIRDLSDLLIKSGPEVLSAKKVGTMVPTVMTEAGNTAHILRLFSICIPRRTEIEPYVVAQEIGSKILRTIPISNISAAIGIRG